MSSINLKWDKEKDDIISLTLTPHHNLYIEDKANKRSMIEKEKKFNEKNDRRNSLDDYFCKNEEDFQNNPNSEITQEFTDYFAQKLTEMIFGTNLINSSEYGIEQNASTITLCSGKDIEEDEYRFSLDWEDCYLNKDTSTLEFRFNSNFFKVNIKFSFVCDYNQKLHREEISIDIIDINHVYPPIGPPSIID